MAIFEVKARDVIAKENDWNGVCGCGRVTQMAEKFVREFRRSRVTRPKVGAHSDVECEYYLLYTLVRLRWLAYITFGQ